MKFGAGLDVPEAGAVIKGGGDDGLAIGADKSPSRHLDELDELYEWSDSTPMTQISTSSGRRLPSGSERKNWMMRDARAGALVTVADRTGPLAPEAEALGKTLSVNGDALAMMIDVLRAATSRSRDAGAAIQFTVEIEPDGGSRIVAGPDARASQPDDVTAEQDDDLDRALEAARARGRDRVAEILAQDDMLSAEAFARHLNTTRATINSKRQSHRVLGLQGATRGYRYPAWQIGEDGRPFEPFPEIFDVFGGSPWAVYRFLVQEHAELDGLSGREALRRGRNRAAVAAAESVAQAFA